MEVVYSSRVVPVGAGKDLQIPEENVQASCVEPSPSIYTAEERRRDWSKMEEYSKSWDANVVSLEKFPHRASFSVSFAIVGKLKYIVEELRSWCGTIPRRFSELSPALHAVTRKWRLGKRGVR